MMLITMTRRIAGVFILACTSTIVLAEPGPAMTGKKLIGFAPDRLDAVYLCKHVAELEKLPMDGVIISVYPDEWAGQKRNRNTLWFGGATFTKEDFSQTVAALKATRFSKLTDNFLDMQTTSNDVPFYGVVAGGRAPVPPSYRLRNVDWFDDKWEEVAQNGAVAAYIAREGGMKGLFIDAEGYQRGGGLWPWPFSYRGHMKACKVAGVTPRTPDQCIAQVRKRGRQFIEAVVAEYPDITIMIIPSIGTAGDAEPPALFSAFVDGMLESSGPDATFIDGMECGYSLQRHQSFIKAREHAELDNLSKTAVPDLFKKKVSYGFGVWLDFECRTRGVFPGWNSDDPAKFELNYRSPARLEQSLYNAFTVSDRYVWLFTWHPQWWFLPHVRGKDNSAQLRDQCPQCRHGDIPEQYIKALEYCRNPHDLASMDAEMESFEERAFSAGYTPKWATQFGDQDMKKMGANLLANAGFEDWSDTPAGPTGWKVFGHSPSITSDKGILKEGDCSAKMTTTATDAGRVYMDQSIPVEPYRGKIILFGIWIKSAKVGPHGIIQIMDYAAPRSETSVGENLADGKWHFTVTRKKIRDDATGSVTFRCQAPFSPGSEPAHFDGAIAVVEAQGK